MLLSGEYGNLENPDAWKYSKLQDYLLFGTWEAKSGLRILAGYKYEDEPTYKAELSTQALYDIELGAERRLKRLSEFWIRDSRDMNEVAAPEIFIEWALTKKIRPTWLDWAVSQGLYTSNPVNEKSAILKVFDKTAATYSYELDCALQVWLAISTTQGKGKPKSRINVWLNNNTKLSGEAKKRIGILANWDKAGGPTRSD